MKLFSKRDERPSIDPHEAFNGLIRVYGAPKNGAWEAGEDEREGDGFVEHVLKLP